MIDVFTLLQLLHNVKRTRREINVNPSQTDDFPKAQTCKDSDFIQGFKPIAHDCAKKGTYLPIIKRFHFLLLETRRLASVGRIGRKIFRGYCLFQGSMQDAVNVCNRFR